MLVATPAVLLVVGAITSLMLQGARSGAHRRARDVASRPVLRGQAPQLPPRLIEPASATELPAVRVVAAPFLRSYLRFVYGSGTAAAVKAVTSAFRRQLTAHRALATPVESGQRPRIQSLGTVATTPGFVVATATIEDGGIAGYQLQFTLREPAGRWLVSSVQEG